MLGYVVVLGIGELVVVVGSGCCKVRCIDNFWKEVVVWCLLCCCSLGCGCVVVVVVGFFWYCMEFGCLYNVMIFYCLCEFMVYFDILFDGYDI